MINTNKLNIFDILIIGFYPFARIFYAVLAILSIFKFRKMAKHYIFSKIFKTLQIWQNDFAKRFIFNVLS